MTVIHFIIIILMIRKASSHIFKPRYDFTFIDDVVLVSLSISTVVLSIYQIHTKSYQGALTFLMILIYILIEHMLQHKQYFKKYINHQKPNPKKLSIWGLPIFLLCTILAIFFIYGTNEIFVLKDPQRFTQKHIKSNILDASDTTEGFDLRENLLRNQRVLKQTQTPQLSQVPQLSQPRQSSQVSQPSENIFQREKSLEFVFTIAFFIIASLLNIAIEKVTKDKSYFFYIATISLICCACMFIAFIALGDIYYTAILISNFVLMKK